MSFKLNWTIKQLSDGKGFAAHKALLKSPWAFYCALFAKLIPDVYNAPIKLTLKNGYVVSIREFMNLYFYKEIFIDGCYDVATIENNAPTIIEIGANTGLFALRMKSNYPEAEILSYEPYPPNYMALLDTLMTNNITKVTPIQKAVSDSPGQSKLYIHPTNIGGHSLFEENAGEAFVEVETTTLEHIISEHDIKVCDLLKLDCGGAEYPILKSLTNSLAFKIRTIIYEPTHSQYSVDALNSHLSGLGYQLTNHHGLVVATRN
jgi:FkbM family methyltransferase